MSPDLTDALKAMLGSEDADCAAMARNLLHDDRVPPPRQSAVDSLVERPVTPSSLEDGVKSYHWDFVRSAFKPHFVDDSYNAINILAGRSDGGHTVSKEVQLGRVLNLSKLERFYRWAQKEQREMFELVPPAKTARIDDWLEEQLREPLLDPFIDAVLGALRDYQEQEEPFEPCWATTWEWMETVAELPANRWNELTGVASTPGQWVLLLRYTVTDTGTLVRPTQLDAGWYRYHVPTPAGLCPHGHPMDLGDDSITAALVPEYIHQQVRHDVRHWQAAGRRIAQTTASAKMSFGKQWARHYSLLLSAYGDSVRHWTGARVESE